jgi:hypothetical protein
MCFSFAIKVWQLCIIYFLALNKASQLLPTNSLCFGILPTLVTQNFLMGLGQGTHKFTYIGSIS